MEFYIKRGNCESYINETKYYMAIGHLLLQSFWVNEVIYQLMMMTYHLFIPFKMDFSKEGNTGSKSKLFGWSTFSLLERISGRSETQC